MTTAYIEKNDIGASFCCWIYCCHYVAFAATRMGHLPYIHWPNAYTRCLQTHREPQSDFVSRGPNQYDWWFRQPFFSGPAAPARDLTLVWEDSPLAGLDVTVYGLANQTVPVIRNWFREHLLIHPDIIARADALAAKYKIDFDKTIAVSWRGCEAAFDPDRGPQAPDGEHLNEAIEAYFPYLDAIMETEPDLRIFATAEEAGVAEKVLARYPNAFMIPEFFVAPRGFRRHSTTINPKSGYERGAETLMLLSLLSRCRHYVKNKSNLSMLAGWISRGNIVYVNHPYNTTI